MTVTLSVPILCFNRIARAFDKNSQLNIGQNRCFLILAATADTRGLSP